MEERLVQCPYCDEFIEILIDVSVGDQEYVEDCQVCCQPMVIRASIFDGEIFDLVIVRENE